MIQTTYSVRQRNDPPFRTSPAASSATHRFVQDSRRVTVLQPKRHADTHLRTSDRPRFRLRPARSSRGARFAGGMRGWKGRSHRTGGILLRDLLLRAGLPARPGPRERTPRKCCAHTGTFRMRRVSETGKKQERCTRVTVTNAFMQTLHCKALFIFSASAFPLSCVSGVSRRRKVGSADLPVCLCGP